MSDGIDVHHIATHCPYCALQCGMHIAGTPEKPEISGNPRFPLNKGGLCASGWWAGATLAPPERLTSPLVRGEDGLLSPSDWDSALDRIAAAFTRIQNRSGPD